MCLTDRDTEWSGYNKRWCFNRERKEHCWRELKCELFQECRRGNVLIGTLRLDKDVRFKRSKAIIKYTTGRCCSKNIFAASPDPNHTPFLFFPLYLALSCQRWKENLISIRLNCGGQHYQFKRPGDLTASTPWWLITSQLWWAPLSPLSLCCCSGGGGGGGWRQHMISAALIAGLTGKRPRQHWFNASQSHPVHPTGPGKLSRYMPFVYSLVCDRKVQCNQLSVLC